MNRHCSFCLRLMLSMQFCTVFLVALFFDEGWSQTSVVATPQQKPQAEKKRYVSIRSDGPVKKVLTVRVENDGKVFYGRPLGQDKKGLTLLRWDGRFSVVPRQKKLEWFSDGFAPYTHEELAKRLRRQYGDLYLVQSSEHFVVVHPRTRRKDWAAEYESVFEQYRSYLASHKIEIAEPTFPMIVVVLGSRSEFAKELSKQIVFKKDVYGFYSRFTNRVTTYVSSDPRIAPRVNRVSALTVVHETVHQAAFNTGVHNRVCSVPRWVTEGFATLFESNGFRKNEPDKPVAERVNKLRLRSLKKKLESGKVNGKLEIMIRNDRLFDTQPELAYGLAWGLSFYLAETYPEKYLRFVIRDSNQNPYGRYTPDQRVAFFLKTFAMDFDTIETNMKAFYAKL